MFKEIKCLYIFIYDKQIEHINALQTEKKHKQTYISRKTSKSKLRTTKQNSKNLVKVKKQIRTKMRVGLW